MTTEVVIATYNRAGPLLLTLDGLARQTEKHFSVAIADDCSEHNVSTWLDPSTFPFATRVVRTPSNQGPAAARNLAVQSSSAELIAFVDDDVVPEDGLLAAHTRTLHRLGPRGVSIGPLRAPIDWKPTPWNRWEADSLAVEYSRMAHGVYLPTWRQFFTGNAMLSRESFLAVGGFDVRFKRAEDIEFAYRLAERGAQFEFQPEAIGWHYAHRTLANWRQIPSQYARYDAEIARLHPELRWLELLSREARQRHRLTRLVELAAGSVGAERQAASVAIATARVAHACGARSISNGLLSLSFQLEYGRTARLVRVGHPFNRTSTAQS